MKNKLNTQAKIGFVLIALGTLAVLLLKNEDYGFLNGALLGSGIGLFMIGLFNKKANKTNSDKES
jgi:hypothetical protein